MADVPRWRLRGDWFDVCRCRVPCGCTFAQPPDDGQCDGVLAWHVREGNYGELGLDDLNAVAVGSFQGNMWTGEAKPAMGFFIDERADEAQREALQAIFGGQAGGWPGAFAELIDDLRGIEFAPINFEIDDGLARWRVEVPGKARGSAEALTGPTTPEGARVQVHNAPAPRSDPARSPPGRPPRRTRWRRSASSGAGPGARASTSPSTGPVPTRVRLAAG
jgi:hypothetical protein